MIALSVDDEQRETRRFVVRYSILTLALCLPLLLAFAFLKNVYPVSASTMMMEGGTLDRERVYYVLRGETVDGQIVEIASGKLTGALYGRTWGMVAATARNENFKLRSVHPANAAMLALAGGVDKLPPGARIPDLLKVWGEMYNAGISGNKNAADRLHFIRLDAYQWEAKRYDDYDKFIQTWRVEL